MNAVEIVFGQSFDTVIYFNVVFGIFLLCHLFIAIYYLRNPLNNTFLIPVILALPCLTICGVLFSIGFGIASTLDLVVTHVPIAQTRNALVNRLSLVAGSMLFPIIMVSIEVIVTTICFVIPMYRNTSTEIKVTRLSPNAAHGRSVRIYAL